MARTIEQVYQSIITYKNNQAELAGLNSTSRTAIYNLFAYVVAVCIVALENLFDLHKSEVNANILLQKPHSPRWYREQALAFQYGQDINELTGGYDNAGLTPSQIAAQKIIAVSSVTEIEGRLRIKAAKNNADDLVALSAPELASFTNYVKRIKDAGVKVQCESNVADQLKLVLDVFYNPLVLNAAGQRIDGTNNQPVKDALKEYLKNLPFNGEYANTRLVDRLQVVDGVELPVVKLAQAKYGLYPFSAIDEKYIPDAGYLRINDEDLIINYRQDV
jgi:hypothetical protein